MKGLLLKYNKVHNHSLQNLSRKLSKDFGLIWGDLESFQDKKDLLSYSVLENFISSFGNIHFIVTGDVFWETGQNLCKYCTNNGIPLFFLQHGQWIYIKNKKRLNHYPSCTMLFGDNVSNMCSSWEYGKHSNVVVTGSPRYDAASPNGGSYVYFSPPVIEELIHNKPTGVCRRSFKRNLEAIKKIDKEVPMVIQPHYREARTDELHKLFPCAQFADPQLDALKLIRGAAKVLTSRNSTVVLDAIAHQKPVVLMDFPEYDACFFKRGYFGEFALESETKSHLVDNLLIDTKIKRTDYVSKSKEHIFLGDASSRIVECIKNGVSSTPPTRGGDCSIQERRA